MDIKTFSKKCSKEITTELEQVTGIWRKKVQAQTPELLSYYDLYIDRLYGGKMFRGMLVKLGYLLANGTPSRGITKAAAAVELLHHSLLIHDDIIDKSEMRRSKTSLYKELGNDHYAISQSICLGDIGFFIANKLITATKFPSLLVIKSLSLINDTVVYTFLGEMLDMRFSSKEKINDYESVLTIHRLKTAYYSVATPLMLGVTLAGGSKKCVNAMRVFGEYLGLVFQIKDDILGIFGDEEIVGKSVTSDIEEGKNTLLIVHAKMHGTKKQKALLNKYYGKGKVTKAVHETIKSIFIDSGSLSYSEQLIEDYSKKARHALEKVDGSTASKKLLNELILYLEKRKN